MQCRTVKSMGAALAAAVVGLSAAVVQANVYPSGVSVDVAGFDAACGTLKVAYVLNENANGDGVKPGVKIEVLNNAQQVVRTVTIARAKKGTHLFEWDGRKDDGSRAPNGNYTVKITAADYGYTVWTRTSDETTVNTTHFERPVGVSVNKNPSSSNYGKVYVSQSSNLTTVSGRVCQDGVYVLKADQSDAGFFTGGVDWSTGDTAYSSPFKSTIGPDDHLYVTAFHADIPYEFNADMSVAAPLIDASNKTASQYVESIYVESTQAAGNRKIYLVDSNYYASAPGRKGLIQYDLGANAMATPGETGVQYIGPGTPAGYFRYYPRDVARDSSGDWYMHEYRASSGQASPLMKFKDGTPPLNTPLWEVSNSYTYAYGIDIFEPKGWAAYAKYSPGDFFIFKMSDGSFVTSVASGSRLREIAFDAAGNVYTVDNLVERLRIFSPPDGANSKDVTTAAVSLNKSGSGGPSISGQPADVTVCAGGTAVFSVTAGGGGLSYQWKKNGAILVDDGVNIIGATTASLTLNNVAAADGGAVLTVVVCNSNGVVVSAAALLNVGVSFLQAPLTQTVCVGASPVFTVNAIGKGSLQYQWQKDPPPADNFENIPGATTTSVTLSNVQSADSGTRVQCVVTDDCGPVTSPAATLTVRTGPTLSHVGYGGTIPPGGSITLTCYASGTGILHYQWKKDGSPVGTDAGSFTLRNGTCADSGLYSCQVTDNCGTAERSTDMLGNPCQVTVGAAGEVCGNGIDDDCDLLLDCADTLDCKYDPACAPPCNDPFADADGDGDVDQQDFAIFQLCVTGDDAGAFDYDACSCFDRDGNKLVNGDDYGKFVECTSGPTIPADIACDDYPSGNVIINEIAYDMWNALGVDIVTDDREFVELYNPSEEDVDIAGWTLRASDTVAPPADDNRDFIIPQTGGGPTILPKKSYYVIGGGAIANVNLIVNPSTNIWENANEAVELIDRNRTVKDALIYERYLGPVAVSPAEGGVWGALNWTEAGLQSVARYLDGLDTGRNGYDFGLRFQTPGANNLGAGAIVTAYLVPDVNTTMVGSDLAGFTGSFVNPRVIDPTIADTNNPEAIPASPQTGNAIIAWDPAGGANMVTGNDVFQGGAAYDMYVYIDTDPYGVGVTGGESWSIGIVGTTDTLYAFPNPDDNPGFSGDVVTACGDTGLAWVFQKETNTNSAPNYLMKLYLVDAGPGGDSSGAPGNPPPATPRDWKIYQTIDLKAQASGWHRLSLSYNSATGAVVAKLDGNTYGFTTGTDLVGSFYIGYRESLPLIPLDKLRPPTIDSIP